jgi:hypothetical protein
MNLRRIAAGASVALVTVVGPVIGLATGPAGADPTNAKRSNVFPITCEENGTLTIVTNGNGRWTPGLVTTNNQVGHPYELHSSGSFTPTGGATQTFTEDFVKPAPRNGRLDVCTSPPRRLQRVRLLHG